MRCFQQGKLAYQGKRQLWRWLWTAAENRVRSMGRQAKVEQREPSAAADGTDALSQEPASTPTPSSHAQRSEERDILANLLRQLSPEDEAAIRNGWLLELKGEDLGKSLGGISASAAAHRRERALKRLAAVAAKGM